MNNINAICEAIIEKANKEKQEKILLANQIVEEKVKTFNKRTEDVIAKVEREQNTEYENKINATKVQVGMEINKVSLNQKSAILDEFFEKIIKKLCDLEQETYQKLIKTLLETYSQDCDEIILSKDTKVNEDFVKSLKVFEEKKLKISSQKADIKGGFVLSNPIYNMVVSFESLVEDYKENNLYKLIEKLF